MINDDLNKVIKIEKELQRRLSCDNLARYNSGEIVHQKQMLFHKCSKRNRWVFGGNRSGKTECGAVEAVWRLRGIHPYLPNKPDVNGWVVSLTTQVSRDVAQRKILHYLSPRYIVDVVMLQGSKDNYAEGVIDYILIRNVFGGISRLGFKSCDQGREKFQGASLDFVWIDEEPPKEIYEECRMRLLDRRGDIWVTMTPLKGINWVHDEIYLNPKNDSNLWHITMEWADNPYLDKQEIEEMSKVLSADDLDMRRYGKFGGRGGLVYRDFDESVHVIEPFEVPKEWYDAISIDPGLNNPLSAHWYAVDYDGNIYVIAEHYEAGKDIDYHAERIKSISEELGWKKDSFGRINALIDSAAQSKTLASAKSVCELFYERGINVNSRVNKDVFSGIARVKYYLKGEKGPKLRIFSHCVNMIREFKTYRWKAGDTPCKVDDHALDELRYYIMTKPAPKLLHEQKSIIAMDKERLIRRIDRSRHRM